LQKVQGCFLAKGRFPLKKSHAVSATFLWVIFDEKYKHQHGIAPSAFISFWVGVRMIVSVSEITGVIS
jgi:hypothetical protein